MAFPGVPSALVKLMDAGGNNDYMTYMSFDMKKTSVRKNSQALYTLIDKPMLSTVFHAMIRLFIQI